MTDVAFNFKDLNQAAAIRDIVRKVSNINASTDTSDIFELSSKLNDLCANKTMIAQLTGPQAHALDLILDLFKDVSTDEISIAYDISINFKRIITPSDVPRFIEMLKEFGLTQYLPNDTAVQALAIQDLFYDWCSQNGDTSIAHDCMELIVSTGNLAWKDAYTWLCNNSSSIYTDVDKELDKLKEAIWQRNQDS